MTSPSVAPRNEMRPPRQNPVSPNAPVAAGALAQERGESCDVGVVAVVGHACADLQRGLRPTAESGGRQQASRAVEDVQCGDGVAVSRPPAGLLARRCGEADGVVHHDDGRQRPGTLRLVEEDDHLALVNRQVELFLPCRHCSPSRLLPPVAGMGTWRRQPAYATIEWTHRRGRIARVRPYRST